MNAKKEWNISWSAARRFARRMTYSWPRSKEVAIRYYDKKYCEETSDLPIAMKIRASICWFDRNYWKNQSVRRWLKSDIRRQLP